MLHRHCRTCRCPQGKHCRTCACQSKQRGRRKFSADQVGRIRELFKTMSADAIARAYGSSQKTIWKLATRRSYREVV